MSEHDQDLVGDAPGPESAVAQTVTQTRLETKKTLAELRAVPPESESLATADFIGRFRVLSKLSEGGQGVVYRVAHPTLATELVLKLSRSTVPAQDRLRHCLVAEGQTLLELQHPGIARVFDLDFHRDRPFLVMEFIRGRTLRQLLKDSQLTTTEAVRLLSVVAEIVGFAHSHGVCHRDLKPDNIVISAAGQPYVIDFGLALLSHAWQEDLLIEGAVSGTPRYMSPEQANGQASQTDARTDVFSLGAILFEILTGQPLYPGERVADVLGLARNGDFDPSRLAVARIPKRLQAVCLKAISKSSSARFNNALELGEALRQLQPQPKARRLIFAAVMLVIVAGFALLRYQPTQPPGKGETPTSNSEQMFDSPQELARVHRQNEVHPLSKSVPVRNGDAIKINCDVPLGVQVAVFWRDEAGRWQEASPCRISDIAGVRQVTCPATGLTKISGGNGTELILVCGSKSAVPTLAELGSLLDRTPWPQLSNDVTVVMSNQVVEVRLRDAGVKPRGGVPSEGDATTFVEERLEALRMSLRQRLDFVAGVAFPHENP